MGSAWWQVDSGCFSNVSDRWSHQRDTWFLSVGRPQTPALSWLPCLSRPTWPSPPSFPATSHTRPSGFHTGLLGRPCRACPSWPLELIGAGPAPRPAGPCPLGGLAPQNPCSSEGPTRHDIWGHLQLSHWGCIGHGVGGAGDAAQPPQCPGWPQRTRLPLCHREETLKSGAAGQGCWLPALLEEPGLGVGPSGCEALPAGVQPAHLLPAPPRAPHGPAWGSRLVTVTQAPSRQDFCSIRP